MEVSLESFESEICEVDTQIRSIEDKISEVEKKKEAAGGNPELLNYLLTEEIMLWKEKEMLRKEKKLIREEKMLLLMKECKLSRVALSCLTSNLVLILPPL